MTRGPELRDALLRELAEGGEDDLETAAALALLAPDVAPPPAMRDRIGRAVAAAHRFDDLEETIASLVDLPIERTRALLLSIDAPKESAAWQRAEWMSSPGIDLLHFEGGPAVAGAITGFVRVPSGTAFPEHEHVGDEAVLVMQGAFRDSDGSVHGRGEVVRMPGGSYHSLEAIGPVVLVYLAVVRAGVRIAGELLEPSDPRI